MRTPPIPRLVLYALAVVLAVALVVAASTTSAAFGAYNVEWDGTSDFRELADQRSDSRVGLETSAYETGDPDDTVAVVLAPASPYEGNDSRRVREFVEAGGTLVVADDVGPHGDALLADVGATARFDGAQLRDERSYYRAPSLPVATNVTDTRYTAGVERLTLNGATAIDPGNATVIATTSSFAYLDRNATGDLSPDDELDAYPVVTVESVGDGRVIGVGDPSLFINAMLTEPDNEAFATALLDARDRTLLDYSQSGDQPPLAVALLGFRSSPPIQAVIGLLGVGAVWGYARRGGGVARAVRTGLRSALPRAWRERVPVWLIGSTAEGDAPPVDEGAVFDAVRGRYPEWEAGRVRRAMTDVLSERVREDEDE
ncbi:DUF4350 domain-containing protein [Halorubrum sp. CBA1125]|uniref:DUF4350 domain-containing protein n=1 Tax=Halorubrum sp. CBA1125 TaxID=2668072 RepID=UPI0012E8C524|nr:DUF4350 domain-containing protein [Halorubrum sp. CBA1125]MUW14936.1 DUF4350 domain-containing protein [Halorubrum sp. CBA1125]